MNIDPDFREVDEPIVTISMGKRQAEWLQNGLSDAACWMRGYLSALQGNENGPLGLKEIRTLNIALKNAIDATESEEQP